MLCEDGVMEGLAFSAVCAAIWHLGLEIAYVPTCIAIAGGSVDPSAAEMSSDITHVTIDKSDNILHLLAHGPLPRDVLSCLGEFQAEATNIETLIREDREIRDK